METQISDHPECRSKRQYLTFNLAALMSKLTSRGRDAPMHPYHCRYCHCWHVGATLKLEKSPWRRNQKHRAKGPRPDCLGS